MNRKKLHEKDLARIVIFLTAPWTETIDLPRKVRRELLNRRTEYLSQKWKKLEQEAYDRRLFDYYDYEYTELFTPTDSGQKLINKYYPKYRQDIHG